MKIVFQKVAQWENKPNAEAKLALRMLIASETIDSVQAIASSDLNEIASFKPDIVIPLHFFTPKLFDAFTLGCMWNPYNAIERNNAWDNIKSYDGYGVASEYQEQLVRELKFRSPEPTIISKLYPSTNATTFKKPENFSSLVYIGSNWSNDQHKDFFTISGGVHVYGPEKYWSHLVADQYQGEIPFDGKSALDIYHKSGIGLALHHSDHNVEGIPSMRPFEIAASGSVMISDQNRFVQREFGDSALYLDTSLTQKEIAEQLEVLKNWIQSHPHQAQEMAEASHNIFINKFSLEILLRNIISDIRKFKNKDSLSNFEDIPQVEIIIRSDGEDRNSLLRALRSIKRQSYKSIAVLLVYRGPADKFHLLQSQLNDDIPDIDVKYIYPNVPQDRSSQLFTGLRASKAPYIGFLDHDDVLFSDHVEVLLDCLSKNPHASIAYSGSVRIWEGGQPPLNDEIRKLAYFYEVNNFEEIKPCLTSNSYIVRREKIPWHILNNPIPEMSSFEDSIFLYMLYKISPIFVFSEKVTCAFYWRTSKQSNSAFNKELWKPSKKAFDLIKRQAETMMAYVDYGTSDSRYIRLHLVKKFSVLINNIVEGTKNFINKK